MKNENSKFKPLTNEEFAERFSENWELTEKLEDFCRIHFRHPTDAMMAMAIFVATMDNEKPELGVKESFDRIFEVSREVIAKAKKGASHE